MPNVMAALEIWVTPSVENDDERKFRNSVPCTTLRHKVWLTPTARMPCSNAVNIGERKTWTQSEFCTWQNSVRWQKPAKCIYNIPA